MDPNETLKKIRTLLKIRRLTREESAELQELVEALDEWMMNGGCAPVQWTVAQRTTRVVCNNTLPGVTDESVQKEPMYQRPDRTAQGIHPVVGPFTRVRK